jgi:biotin carboxylase
LKHVVFVDSTVTGMLAFQAAKRLGCYVTFIKPTGTSMFVYSMKDDEKLKPHLAYVDQCLEVASLDDNDLHKVLVEVNEKRSIDAIISTSEASIVPVAREAERFGTLYPRSQALINAVFKNRCRLVLRDAGIRSPDFEVLNEDKLIERGPKHVKLPFVVKPTRGFGKQFSAICKSEQDFKNFASSVKQSRQDSDRILDQLVSRDYLVEEYVDGSLHSAEIIVQEGVVSCYATTVRFRSYYNEMLEMTATMPSGLTTQQNDAIKKYVQEVFTALDLKVGLYHVELLMDKDGPCLVEINARMMGSVAPQMYRMMTSIDPFEMLVRIHLGQHVDIDDSVLKSAGTVVTVGSRNGGVIRADYDDAALQRLLKRYGIEFCTLNLYGGRELTQYEGNLSVIGHVIVLGDTPLGVARTGHQFLTDLEPIMGVELAKYFDPETFETVN